MAPNCPSASERFAAYGFWVLRRSPLALAGWVLAQGIVESSAIAIDPPAAASASSSLTTNSPAIIFDTEAIASTATPVIEASPSTTSPQFSQSYTSPTLVAQAITPAMDGTGTVVTQTDSTFTITGGSQAGDNLFHSFEQLGLSAEQTANILSNPDIVNILGRVVGGEASVINGRLQVTGGNSNLFLINPSGIIFGPDANVIMPAAFTATTANAIEIGDFWFEATGIPDYTNLIGDPTGFAFTSDNPGMVINAGSLSADSAVTLLGGYVLNTGTIQTPGGTINIATVLGENLVRITPEGSLLSLELPLDAPAAPSDLDVLTVNDLPALLAGEVAPEELGVIVKGDTVRLVTTDTEIPADAGTTIIAGSLNTADTSLEGMGGAIDVLGDRVGLIDANLEASGTDGGGTIRVGGDYQGNGDIPNADFTYIDSNSTLVADALDHGDGGEVTVWADQTTQFFGDISARGGSDSGDGGFVEVSGKENLGFNGNVDVGSLEGEPGELLLDPDRVVIDAVGTDDAGFAGTIAADEEPADLSISATKIVEILETGNVEIAANDEIVVESAIDASGNATVKDLTLTAGFIRLNQDIQLNAGNLTFNGPVFVGNDLTLSTGSDTGNIVFASTVNGAEGAHELTLFAGVGDVQFQDAVGAYRNIPGDNGLTFQVADISPDSFGSFLSSFTAVGDLLYFAADDGISGTELWRSDGTAAGTFLVKDIFPGSDEFGGLNDSRPEYLTEFDGTVLFAAEDGITGRELWRSDGTLEGTFLIKDIYPGSDDLGNLNDSSPQHLTPVEDTIYFAAEDGVNGTELWRTDGTAAGTRLVADINDGPADSGPANFAGVDEIVYFGADDGDTGQELWRSDGTEAGTFIVADIYPGINGFGRPNSSSPSDLVNSDGVLFFTASDGVVGRELWRSEGTPASTFVVKDINPGVDDFSGRPNDSRPEDLIDINGTLFFFANDGDAGEALWQSDGTEAGTQLVVDINPGTSAFAGLGSLTNIGDTLFFAADDGSETDIELWRSDGTVAGTQLVANINPTGSSALDELTNVNGTLFFEADDGITGRELWRSDGTPQPFALGTVAIQIVDPDAPGQPGANKVELPSTFYVNEGAIEIVSQGSVITADQENPSAIVGDKVTILSGGAILTGDITSGSSVLLQAKNDIQVNDINADGSSIDLRSTIGDITVNTVFGGNSEPGSTGIIIDAAGTFRALGARPSVSERYRNFDILPEVIVEALTAAGYDDLSGYEYVQVKDSFVSLRFQDGPITIRYGQNREALTPPEVFDADEGIGYLIEGDLDQYFIVGPSYDSDQPLISVEEVEFDGGGLLLSVNSQPLDYLSEIWPEGTGGIAAGILSDETDGSLDGSLQSQVFGALPPPPEPPVIEPPVVQPPVVEPPVINPPVVEPPVVNPPVVENPPIEENSTVSENPNLPPDQAGVETPEGEAFDSMVTDELTTEGNTLCDSALLSAASSSNILEIDESVFEGENISDREIASNPCKPQSSSEETDDTSSEPTEEMLEGNATIQSLQIERAVPVPHSMAPAYAEEVLETSSISLTAQSLDINAALPKPSLTGSHTAP